MSDAAIVVEVEEFNVPKKKYFRYRLRPHSSDDPGLFVAVVEDLPIIRFKQVRYR